MKIDKNVDGLFEYMFINTEKIVGGLGKYPPLMKNTVSVEIDLAWEIYVRLPSKGLRRTDEIVTKKKNYIFSLKLIDENNLKFNKRYIN